jgi:hypothetical protein
VFEYNVCDFAFVYHNYHVFHKKKRGFYFEENANLIYEVVPDVRFDRELANHEF